MSSGNWKITRWVCSSVAGEVNGRKFFPVIATIFLFVLFNAWLSLLPGFISFEYKEYTPLAEYEHVLSDNGHETEYVVVEKDGVEMVEHKYEILRGANTDFNTPLAIALVSFVFVIFYGMKSLGIGFWRQYFNFGRLFSSIGKILTGKFPG